MSQSTKKLRSLIATYIATFHNAQNPNDIISEEQARDNIVIPMAESYLRGGSASLHGGHGCLFLNSKDTLWNMIIFGGLFASLITVHEKTSQEKYKLIRCALDFTYTLGIKFNNEGLSEFGDSSSHLYVNTTVYDSKRINIPSGKEIIDFVDQHETVGVICDGQLLPMYTNSSTHTYESTNIICHGQLSFLENCLL